jgi:hypothetical protein
MKSQLTIVFILVTLFSFGRTDTTYLNSDWKNVSTLDSAAYYNDYEAIRLVRSMPKWYPGYQDGYPIRVAFVLPINFTL